MKENQFFLDNYLDNLNKLSLNLDKEILIKISKVIISTAKSNGNVVKL